MSATTTPLRYRPTLADVRGQEDAKTAMREAANSGQHLLLVGAPGTGKTMLARCLPGLLPPLTDSEALEVTVIHAVAGLYRLDSLPEPIRERPFRAPHHTASIAALVGGNGRPGEAALAHRGVLFLDELPEFPARSIEALRDVIAGGSARTGGIAFPARFQCVASMNECPCGWGPRLCPPRCGCTPEMIARYRARIDAVRDLFRVVEVA